MFGMAGEFFGYMFLEKLHLILNENGSLLIMFAGHHQYTHAKLM